MHHADTDIDVTTGARFHPVEILISMLIKFTAIKALGCLPMAVITFEILLNLIAMFNHGNIFISEEIDKKLRWFLVTPDMHRIHHSVHEFETNSNFGFNLPWWDRLFGTYIKTPVDGHQDMKIGIEYFRNKKYLNLHWLLLIPFLKEVKDMDVSEEEENRDIRKEIKNEIELETQN
jgi:sterol desaturase/sphingolipid hydroxylase (fatty acid hydroxylase superfamily)